VGHRLFQVEKKTACVRAFGIRSSTPARFLYDDKNRLASCLLPRLRYLPRPGPGPTRIRHHANPYQRRHPLVLIFQRWYCLRSNHSHYKRDIANPRIRLEPVSHIELLWSLGQPHRHVAIRRGPIPGHGHWHTHGSQDHCLPKTPGSKPIQAAFG
jgi:hypothetical protein